MNSQDFQPLGDASGDGNSASRRFRFFLSIPTGFCPKFKVGCELRECAVPEFQICGGKMQDPMENPWLLPGFIELCVQNPRISRNLSRFFPVWIFLVYFLPSFGISSSSRGLFFSNHISHTLDYSGVPGLSQRIPFPVFPGNSRGS